MYSRADLIEDISYLNKAGFSKNSQESFVSALTSKTKDYVAQHINEDDKVGSLVNMIAPGAISMLLKSFGFGWLSFLIPLLISTFHVDVNGILQSIFSKISSSVKSNTQLSSSDVNSIVSSSVLEHSNVSKESYHSPELIKIAIIKDAGILDKSSYIGFFSKILSWVFRVILSSAGFMVAGDIIGKAVGVEHPTNKPKEQAPSKFKIKPTYDNKIYNESSDWTESIMNDDSSISDMLIDFTNSVYEGFENKESLIKSSPAFNVVKNNISFYNKATKNHPIVYIPKMFKSKKQIVDYFIEDL